MPEDLEPDASKQRHDEEEEEEEEKENDFEFQFEEEGPAIPATKRATPATKRATPERHGGTAKARKPEDYSYLVDYYERYNAPAGRATMKQSQEAFKGVGVRVQPARGAAILWPNVDLDDILVQVRLVRKTL